MNRVIMAIRWQDRLVNKIFRTYFFATEDLIGSIYSDFAKFDPNPNFLGEVVSEFLATIGVNFLEFAKRYRIEVTDYYSRLQEMELSPYPLTAEYLERLESKNELTVSVAPSDCQYFVGWKECYAPPYHETICLHPKRVKQQCCELSRYNVCTITGGNYPPKKKSDIIKELNSG